ncbi:hypothetical protein GCM10020220_018230 [Nonomuraea rubra]
MGGRVHGYLLGFVHPDASSRTARSPWVEEALVGWLLRGRGSAGAAGGVRAGGPGRASEPVRRDGHAGGRRVLHALGYEASATFFRKVLRADLSLERVRTGPGATFLSQADGILGA